MEKLSNSLMLSGPLEHRHIEPVCSSMHMPCALAQVFPARVTGQEILRLFVIFDIQHRTGRKGQNTPIRHQLGCIIKDLGLQRDDLIQRIWRQPPFAFGISAP